MKEIEYKFLLKNLPKQIRDEDSIKIEMTQYYLDIKEVKKYYSKLNIENKELKNVNHIRLRFEKTGDITEIILTVKSDGNKIRDEYEKAITPEEATEILKAKHIGKVKKNRYRIAKNGYIYEFDEYFEHNTGLFTCEVEVTKFNDNYPAITSILTNYFNCNFVDITNDKRYKNVNLSQEAKKWK